MGHGRQDRLPGGVRRGNQRQPHPLRRLAQKAGAVFDRSRAAFQEQRPVQRHQQIAQPSHLGQIAGTPGIMKVGAVSRRDIGSDRNTAVPPLGQERRHGRVLPRQLTEIGADLDPGAQGPGEVIRRILDADDVRQLREPLHGFYTHVDYASARDVVDQNRNIR